MSQVQPLLFLEFNEVNFDFVEFYVGRGQLPNFGAFLAKSGLATTSSEHCYEELEPWIQWVTAHTGKTLEEHGVFRLGDIVDHDHEQIWERLAALGFSAGAISPMNAKLRSDKLAFFLPDPWTPTGVIGSPLMRRLLGAIAQAVNENAEARISPRSLLNLLTGWIAFAPPSRWSAYIKQGVAARTQSWRKAIILDFLLADLFVAQVKTHRPTFASLFLNAAAHIQHHYMFSSDAYSGPLRNPDWYVCESDDPLFDVYAAYDDILGQVKRRLPGTRIQFATGLHQDPHSTLTYYWRLRDHNAFLKRVGLPFATVEPRMSRDFVVFCDNAEQAKQVEQGLCSALVEGHAMFEVDNRGASLFVMLSYPYSITEKTSFVVNGLHYDALLSHVAFVAIKNGQHNGMGYFSDSGTSEPLNGLEFPLAKMPDFILRALGVVSEIRSREPTPVG